MTTHTYANGNEALSLMDSGSSIEGMSSDFAAAHGITTFALDPPVRLQMGCVGSRGLINFGANVEITLGTRTKTVYFDVLNVDHYDLVLGVGFMIQFGIVPDFTSQEIRFGNDIIHSLPAPTETRNTRSGPRGTSGKYEWAHQRENKENQE